MRCLLTPFVLWIVSSSATADDSICTSPNNIFTLKVNLFAGELGYYTIEECGDMPNPTIGMEVGETYTFLQTDRSNFYHPVGLAYFPDGAHADVNELEPGISEGTNGCEQDSTCPAPMYFVGGEYAGIYSNIAEVTSVTTGEDDFGLDAYEPLFFLPLADWADQEPYSVQLKFDDETYDKDIFYFCHIHQFMTGRIKLLKDGNPISETDQPTIDYEYDMPTGFDAECGTFQLNDFQLPNPECPQRFVCDADQRGGAYADFAGCIDAMNCHMMAGMTTGSSSGSEVALFIHQMIPHHQNAVNMAKALLKTNLLKCDDVTDETDDCAMEIILREIINNQNFQIQGMRAIADSKGYPAEDDCVVSIGGGKKGKKSGKKGGKKLSSSDD